MPNDYNHLSREELLVLLEKSETENRRLKSSQGSPPGITLSTNTSAT